MTRETILTLAILVAVFVHGAKADGIGENLVDIPPCWERAFTQADAPMLFAVVEDGPAQIARAAQINADNCAPVVALAQNYTPGHPTMYWHQPKPLPSPVPLPSTGQMMLAGLGAIFARRLM